MATLLHDIERPAFLDPPAEEQLSFGGGAARSPAVAPPREARPAREPLSDRLQTERAVAAAAVEANLAGATPARNLAPRGGEATLDELLVGAWEGLSAHRPVACPVCAELMHPTAEAAGGACGGCGAGLR